MKKYHVAAGDGKGYYGVNYESYREATELLKISQRHDPKAHIVEEEYHFTNADRIRAMSDDDLAYWIMCPYDSPYCDGTEHNCIECTKEWLNKPAEEPQP